MVAKSYYTSDKSLARIGKEFKVKTSTVYNWAQRYKVEFSQEKSIQQEITTFSSVINTDSPVKKKKLTSEQLEQRNLELEAQLKEEQMRSITLNQMIDMAEQELKISIRKKSGAKQSK
jgi:transposase